MTTKDIKEYCSNLIAELASAGYEPIAGGALHDDCWRTYVIHVDSPDSHSLYVGQTHYPVEIRFKQHQYGIRSARIFHKHEPHSLAYALFDGATYDNQAAAIAAEQALADSLRKKGFAVKSS